jgi:mannosyltransferase
MVAASAFAHRAPGARVAWRVTPLGLVLSITVLALAVRVIGLGSRPFWLDEAFSAWFSAQSWHYLWSVVPTYEAHPPFYYSLLKLWRGVVGDGAIGLRGLSVLFGTVTVPVVMLAALELERQRPSGRPLLGAGVAGFLAACSPMLVLLGQEARPYPLLTFAYAVSILGLLRLIRQLADGGPGQWSSWLLLAVGAELLVWAHALGILYASCLALALAPAWLKPPVSRERLVRGLAAALAVALLYLPCLLLLMSRAHDWGTNWLHWEPGMLLQLVVLYSVPVEVLTVGSAVAALTMLLLIKRALVPAITARGWNPDRAIFLVWLGPPVLSALISASFVPIFLARTLAGTLIPAYLAIGSAIARTQSQRERTVLTAAICITLLPTAVQVATRPGAERWDEVASYLDRNVAPQDQVWLYPSDSALPLNRVGRKIPAPMRLVPAPFPTLGLSGPIRAGWRAMVSVTPLQAAKIASDPAVEHVPVIWLVTRQSGIFDPNNDFPSALARVRRPGKIEEWGYIGVQPYYARPTHGAH